MEMVQLWVNLPAKDKMSPPRVPEIARVLDIPVVTLPGGAGSVRVIAGAFDGTKGAAKTFTPIDVWDLRLRAAHAADVPLPDGHTTALLVLRGSRAS